MSRLLQKSRVCAAGEIFVVWTDLLDRRIADGLPGLPIWSACFPDQAVGDASSLGRDARGRRVLGRAFTEARPAK
ncbi:hypothetical protein E4V01_03290 [Methylorubrum sp. Q1]|uniref:hypothetical protein n=1 Tax=Methylorubrum sp. Q1 TaxID=2562453 RepID=UPI0010762360|nr:hypothetical protein [Methylorubrum sp. Q1]TFZ60847.1 hypothetical protein E4V01_03290 [Methylorubrum sp. Q1]